MRARIVNWKNWPAAVFRTSAPLPPAKDATFASCCAPESGHRESYARVAAAIAVAAGVLLSGCSPIEPWVKPYEREHFADPIMALNRDPVSTTYREHVFESREGARGATGGVGGGCGCN